MGAFKEIGRVQTGEKNSIVFSKTGEGKFILAKCLKFLDENNNPKNFFYKNALDMTKEGLEQLYEIIGKELGK